ncbi:hypothetical protein [Empedobacter sp. GD03739]|uniref:hypothetical protein n=1 Tax=Empedobacter sp. GD03739 TaxID=2975376 RepID=UPI00244CCADC|nr:hypothetical protein [Empedobacter sp. GD03739]MDH1603781.1 hypothetical protein [Empedobacter sp. GD03739]
MEIKLKTSILFILILWLPCFVMGKSTHHLTERKQDLTEVELKVKDFIEERVAQSIANETQYFSWAPFRMFYHTVFLTRTEREDFWMHTFRCNGLNEVELDRFINNTLKNKHNFSAISYQLEPLMKEKIMDDQTYEALNEMELSVWYQNIWFDGLLILAFVCVVGLFGGLFFFHGFRKFRTMIGN